MTEDNPYLPWPGADDQAVVEEMQGDSTSIHWYECYEFIRRLVQIRAKNIPQDQWDDIIQDAIVRTGHSLATFQFQCRFKNWVFSIVNTTIIDAHRRNIRKGQFTASLSDPHEDTDYTSDPFILLTARTVEDECIIIDELAQVLTALQEYLATHANTQRNSIIIDLVMFEGRSLEDAAKAVGCSAPVAGYVIRTARRYLREKLKQ